MRAIQWKREKRLTWIQNFLSNWIFSDRSRRMLGGSARKGLMFSSRALNSSIMTKSTPLANQYHSPKLSRYRLAFCSTLEQRRESRAHPFGGRRP